MWLIRKTSVRELHIHTSELARQAIDGGQPVAERRSIGSRTGIPAARKARIFTSMREIWARMPQVSDSITILEEDRNR
jgi:hypothetical protein